MGRDDVGIPDRLPTSRGDATGCPVCGMAVAPTTPFRARHAGRDVLFCSATCETAFDRTPAGYVARV